jgi:hypothetical protein
MKQLFYLWVFLVVGVSTVFGSPRVTLSCSGDNDLLRVLKQSSVSCSRHDSAEQAIAKAAFGSAVLILADGYPEQRTRVPASALKMAEEKHLRLFLEYPEPIEGIEFTVDKPQTTTWERGIVASGVFGTSLARLSILAVHGCYFIPVKAEKPWLVVGRVAGFDRAIYGIPTNASPLLFEIPDRSWIVAPTKLSNFVTARYAPAKDWTLIWETILAKLYPGEKFHLDWEPTVKPVYSAAEKLPRDFEKRAFNAATEWIHQSRLLVPPERTNEIYAAMRANAETGLVPQENSKSADGSLGILEGYASGILHNGDQLQRLPLRADCHTESAAVLAFDKLLNNDKRSGAVAGNLLDYVYFNSDMCGGPRADPNHGAYGLISWGAIAPAWMVANYGDDNARAIMGTIATAAALKNSKWDEVIAKALLANFRTTGKLGFRGDRIDNPALASGWKQFFDAEPVNYSPHFESGLWACNLWAYRATGYEPFLNRATNAMAMTMKAYPNGWRWGDNMERARMLLCLAWLVRIADTPLHREWLFTVANDLLKHQQPNGTIRDWLVGAGGGHYQIPQSNEAYGTAETPLIQKNGDAASDQLYTTGFALLGLHEAVAATGDSRLKRAEDNLAAYLCRIQVQSKDKPYLDGWWFRAFDDNRWEYWASSADVGWGAWSVEAGWAQAWTAVTLALRQQKTTFWDFTESVAIREEFEAARQEMLPGR